jgi:hypothetical protein
LALRFHELGTTSIHPLEPRLQYLCELPPVIRNRPRRFPALICSTNGGRGTKDTNNASSQAPQLNDGLSGRKHRAHNGVVQATRVRM